MNGLGSVSPGEIKLAESEREGEAACQLTHGVEQLTDSCLDDCTSATSCRRKLTRPKPLESEEGLSFVS